MLLKVEFNVVRVLYFLVRDFLSLYICNFLDFILLVLSLSFLI